MSSMADVILRLGALLSLPVRRAGRVLLHPRALFFCTNLLVPDFRDIFQSRGINGHFFTPLSKLCAGAALSCC